MASIFDIQPLAYIGSKDGYKEITKTDMWNRYVDTVFENAGYENDELKEFLYESPESSIFDMYDSSDDMFTEGFGSNLSYNLKTLITKIKNAIISMVNKFKATVQASITRGSIKKTVDEMRKFIIKYPDLSSEIIHVRDIDLLVDILFDYITDANHNRRKCDIMYDEFMRKCDRWYKYQTSLSKVYISLSKVDSDILPMISAAVKTAELAKKRSIIELEKISRESAAYGNEEKYQADVNYVNFVLKSFNLFLNYTLMDLKDTNNKIIAVIQKSSFYNPSKTVNDDLAWRDLYGKPSTIENIDYNFNKQMEKYNDPVRYARRRMYRESGDLDTITEGANIDVHNKMKEAKRGYKESMKKIKSLMKNDEYSEAHREVSKAIEFLNTMKNETKNVMKNKETSDFTALKGLILQTIIETAKILIVTIVTGGFGTVLATAMLGIKDTTNYLSNLQSKKGDISAADYNMYYVNIMKLYDKQIKTLKIMDNKISDAENGKINLDKGKNVKDKVSKDTDDKSDEDEDTVEESTYDIITEAYKGKTPNLLKAEAALSKLTTSMKIDSLKDYTNSPDNKALENALRDQFGFKSVNISWQRFPSAASNIFTLFNINVLFGNSPGFADSKTGYYDKNHKHVLYIVADSNAVKNLGWSAQEYLAVILHEIGHNFDSSPYMLIYLAMLTISQLASIIQVKNISIDYGDHIEYYQKKSLNLAPIAQIASMTNTGRTVINAMTTFIEKIKAQFPVLKKFMDGVKILGSTLSRWVEKGISPLITLSIVPAYVLCSPLLQLKSIFTRKNEQHADSFAVYYGYGDSLASALSSLETKNLNVDKVYSPINRVLTDLALVNRTIIGGLCGDHGSQDTRIMDTILLIENEIKRGDYPPEVVAELKRQLENTKLTYKVFMEGGENKFAATAFVRETLANLFGGRTDYIARLFPSYSYLDVKEYTDELTDEEVDELAEENSASTNGAMLPQGNLPDSTSSFEGMKDSDLSKEIDKLTKTVNEACGGPYIYSSELLCESGLFQDTVDSIIDKFRSIGKVSEDKIRNDKTLKVCKIYSSIVSNQIRMRVEVAKDSKEGKESKTYKKALANTIKLEKDLRKQVDQLTTAEKTFFNNFKKELDQKSKPIEKKLIDEVKKIANTGKRVGIETESYKDLINAISDCYLRESPDNEYKSLEEEIYNEGANTDVLKKLKDSMKVWKDSLNNTKTYIKKKQYGKARSEIDKLIKYIKDIKDETKKIMSKETDSVFTAIKGFILNNVIDFANILIVAVVTLGHGTTFASVITTLKNLINIIVHFKDKASSKEGLTAKDFNLFYINTLKVYDTMIELLKKWKQEIDKQEKDFKSKTYKESVAEECGILEEAANIDPEIQTQIDKLNKKGYVTKYSSPGHDNVRIKPDSNKDGAYYGKLYNDARIMFDDKYDFPEAPKGWFWRQVDGKSYLDIKPKSYNKYMGSRDEVYKKWKSEYMSALDEWIDNLPDNGEKKSDDEPNDKDTENTTVKEFADDFLFDLAISSGVDAL